MSQIPPPQQNDKKRRFEDDEISFGAPVVPPTKRHKNNNNTNSTPLSIDAYWDRPLSPLKSGAIKPDFSSESEVDDNKKNNNNKKESDENISDDEDEDIMNELKNITPLVLDETVNDKVDANDADDGSTVQPNAVTSSEQTSNAENDDNEDNKNQIENDNEDDNDNDNDDGNNMDVEEEEENEKKEDSENGVLNTNQFESLKYLLMEQNKTFKNDMNLFGNSLFTQISQNVNDKMDSVSEETNKFRLNINNNLEKINNKISKTDNKLSNSVKSIGVMAKSMVILNDNMNLLKNKYHKMVNNNNNNNITKDGNFNHHSYEHTHNDDHTISNNNNPSPSHNFSQSLMNQTLNHHMNCTLDTADRTPYRQMSGITAYTIKGKIVKNICDMMGLKDALAPFDKNNKSLYNATRSMMEPIIKGNAINGLKGNKTLIHNEARRGAITGKKGDLSWFGPSVRKSVSICENIKGSNLDAMEFLTVMAEISAEVRYLILNQHVSPNALWNGGGYIIDIYGSSFILSHNGGDYHFNALQTPYYAAHISQFKGVTFTLNGGCCKKNDGAREFGMYLYLFDTPKSAGNTECDGFAPVTINKFKNNGGWRRNGNNNNKFNNNRSQRSGQ